MGKRNRNMIRRRQKNYWKSWDTLVEVIILCKGWTPALRSSTGWKNQIPKQSFDEIHMLQEKTCDTDTLVVAIILYKELTPVLQSSKGWKHGKNKSQNSHLMKFTCYRTNILNDIFEKQGNKYQLTFLK